MDNDSTLICRARAGDEGAFVDLIRAYHAYVYAIVIEMVNNPQDAEEIVQDTFLNAYRGLAEYEERSKFKTWLAEIARNRARSWLRKQRIATVPIDELCQFDEVGKSTLKTQDLPDEQLILSERRALIRRALGTLSPKEREIAHSYYLDGASYDELMSTHGLSYKAISVRLSRAKQKLAKRLGHLLTVVFVPPITSLKNFYSGGLTFMKVGTVPKITAGAIVIILLAFIGTRQFISSKGDSSPSVEVVTSTETANLVAQTDAMRKGTATAPPREDKPKISAAEMQQIEDFFAQLEEADAQAGVDASRIPSESKNESSTTVTDTSAEVTGLSAEELMNFYVEAYKNLDFEAMLPHVTGTARDIVEIYMKIPSGELQEEYLNNVINFIPEGLSEELADDAIKGLEEAVNSPMWWETMRSIFSQVEVVDSEYVGDEFHFEFRMTFPKIEMPDLSNMPDIPGMELPEIPELPEMPGSIDMTHKMRKEDGAWRIYE